MSIAGIDIGTSGCKVIVFRENGQIIYSARRTYQEIKGNGIRELDPLTVTENVMSALYEAATACTEKICAIAITTRG